MTNKKINESMRYLDKTKSYKRNVFKMNRNEGFSHCLAKFLICHELVSNGIDFISEAIFENGKRADIFDLVNCEAIEILSSEKESNLVNKREDYPVMIRHYEADTVINYWANKLFEK